MGSDRTGPKPQATRGVVGPPYRGLPVPRGALVGRAADLAQMERLLLRTRTGGLLTLTGPAGVGKTRLALHAAAHLAGRFADGVAAVGLEGVRDSALVLPAIAEVLDVREAEERPLLTALERFLRGKHLLLVLDNCEHVLDAAGPVARLLASCPRLTILATSRAPLRVSGEQEYQVPPLAVPAVDDSPPPERLGQFLAVHLFVTRAQEIQPEFALSADDAAAVAEICRRLDGLPLALELAAARVRVLPPWALLERLDRRLGVLLLLNGGARDLPPRHQTLRGAIAWSYELLAAPEQALFRELGVFVGGCTLAAAEAVCRGQAGLTVLDGVASLVEKSLVRREVLAEPAAPAEPAGLAQGSAGRQQPRFRMLETIREFALEQLQAAGGTASLERGHAAYYVALAEAGDEALRGPAQVEWLRVLEREQENFRQALRWALEQGAVDVGLRLCGALSWFWYWRGRYTEGRQWLAAFVAQPAPRNAAEQRAKALFGAGLLAYAQGSHAAAAASYKRCLAASQQTARHDEARPHTAALALLGLGQVAQAQGDFARGRERLEESLAVFRRLADSWGAAFVLYVLGLLHSRQGDRALARQRFEESLALARHIGDQMGIARALAALGLVASLEGEYQTAWYLYQEGLELDKALGDRRAAAWRLLSLSRVAHALGDPVQARDYAAQSIALFRGVGESADAAHAAGHAPPAPSAPDPQPRGGPAGHGPATLTKREHEVAALITQGLTNRQVAERLVVAERTVDAHAEHIRDKLGVQTRAQIAAWVVARDLAPAGRDRG